MIGTLQRNSGQPSATFTIDGQGNTTYIAPTYMSSADAVYNVTFYSRLDLDSGNHQLTILNMNGTGQNVFWLDFFLIDPSSSPLQETAPAQTAIVSSPATSSVQSSSSIIPSPTSSPNSSGSSSSINSELAASPTSACSPVPCSFNLPQSQVSSFSLSSSLFPTDSGSSLTSSFVSLSPTFVPTIHQSPSFSSSSATGPSMESPAPTSSSSDSKRRGNAGFIVGAVVGGVLLITTFIVLIALCRRRRNNRVCKTGPLPHPQSILARYANLHPD